MPLCKPCVPRPESLNRSIDSGAFYVLCKLCLDPREPTFLGFPIMISLYKSLKKVGSLGSRCCMRMLIVHLFGLVFLLGP